MGQYVQHSPAYSTPARGWPEAKQASAQLCTLLLEAPPTGVVGTLKVLAAGVSLMRAGTEPSVMSDPLFAKQGRSITCNILRKPRVHNSAQ
jgi:hypothetical protein